MAATTMLVILESKASPPTLLSVNKEWAGANGISEYNIVAPETVAKLEAELDADRRENVTVVDSFLVDSQKRKAVNYGDDDEADVDKPHKLARLEEVGFAWLENKSLESIAENDLFEIINSSRNQDEGVTIGLVKSALYVLSEYVADDGIHKSEPPQKVIKNLGYIASPDFIIDGDADDLMDATKASGKLLMRMYNDGNSVAKKVIFDLMSKHDVDEILNVLVAGWVQDGEEKPIEGVNLLIDHGAHLFSELSKLKTKIKKLCKDFIADDITD